MARSLFSAVLLLILLQAGCGGPPLPIASPQSPRPDPPPAPGYSPRKVYELIFSEAWEEALQALREANLPMSEQEREKGILRTEYIKGPDLRQSGREFSTRYKYNLFFFRDSERRTILNVRCQYETKEKIASTFTNATDLFPDEVIALEKDLYQLIESRLLPLEASRRAAPGGKDGRKAARSASPATAVASSIPPPERPSANEPILFPPPAAAPMPKEKASSPVTPAPEYRPASPPPAPAPAREPGTGASRVEPQAKAVPPKPAPFLFTKRNANLREGPTDRSKIILVLKPGRKVEKVGESGNWVQIRIWETTTGWIQKDLLEETPP